MKHCRGILLYGPPGTGKTLMARYDKLLLLFVFLNLFSMNNEIFRQIGKMLNAREPKIVNGPQVLDKYVGESEANIRKLFAEADDEEKRVRLLTLKIEQINIDFLFPFTIIVPLEIVNVVT